MQSKYNDWLLISSKKRKGAFLDFSGIICQFLVHLNVNIHIGKGAAGFGEKERYTEFSGGTAKILCEEKMDMAFRLDFCFFWSSKRKHKE